MKRASYGRVQSKNKLMMKHRIVAEKVLGRVLPQKAVVHHVNGDGLDNRHSNLVICENQSYHFLLHVRQRARDTTGDPHKRFCGYCKQWDIPSNMARYSSRITDLQFIHAACRAEKLRTWRSNQPAAEKAVRKIRDNERCREWQKQRKLKDLPVREAEAS